MFEIRFGLSICSPYFNHTLFSFSHTFSSLSTCQKRFPFEFPIFPHCLSNCTSDNHSLLPDPFLHTVPPSRNFQYATFPPFLIYFLVVFVNVIFLHYLLLIIFAVPTLSHHCSIQNRFLFSKMLLTYHFISL